MSTPRERSRRGQVGSSLRQVLLFIVFNVVGLALGTAFRYWSYGRFVFAEPDAPTPRVRPAWVEA